MKDHQCVLVGVLILERGYEAAADEAVSADEKDAHGAFRMMTESRETRRSLSDDADVEELA
jgi:hypothetical protein